MKFLFYNSGIDQSRTMVVDGVEKCRVNLSHWPNNQTPEHLKADTSTEIALNLAVDPYADRLFENIEYVSNNHFDTDGLLSCWTAMNPHEALPHKEFLIRAAEAGDFGWFTTPEAVRFDLAVSAFEDPQRSPLKAHFAGLDETQKYQLIYETLLGELPGLLRNFQARYRELYEEEFARLAEARSALAGGAATIHEYSETGLSVIDARKEFPLTSRFNACRHDRLLTFVEDEGGLRSEFFYHIVTWFETKTLSKRPRIDLAPLVNRLNAIEERTDARWRFDSLAAFYPRLALTDSLGIQVPSRLSRKHILHQFLEFFENAEPSLH